MNNATPVVVPLANVADERVILVHWLVSDGAEVKEGQPIAEVETSKAVIEILAPGNGTIAIVVEPGQEVEVGAVVAHLNSGPSGVAAIQPLGTAIGAATALSQPVHRRPAVNAVSSSLPGVRFSKRALVLIDQHSLSPELFRSQAMVREADVLAVLADADKEPARSGLHFSLQGVSLAGVTLPAGAELTEAGKLDQGFLDHLRKNRKSFGELSSAERCEEYRKHGAVIGLDVTLGDGTVILAPQIVLEDGVLIGENSSVECSERFVAGRLSSFRKGLSIEASTVVVGENVFGCYRVEISGGTTNPWSLLYVGDTTFIGDDVILDISRPIVIGKEAYLTQRSIVITHNIGHSILEGYENRFEPVVLEDYCQVGMNSTIYAGSRIGSAAIVASNSYVISSIPAGMLAIGVPAQVVRGAARPLSRKQQVHIAQRMVQDYRDLLKLKGFAVTPVDDDTFSLEYGGKRFRLVFQDTFAGNAIDFASSDLCVIWALHASSSPPPGCTLVDLLGKTIEGEGGIFVDTTREFLRKRGIRCKPGPWRYREGLI